MKQTNKKNERVAEEFRSDEKKEKQIIQTIKLKQTHKWRKTQKKQTNKQIKKQTNRGNQPTE